MASAKDDAWTPKVKVSRHILAGVQELGGQDGQLPTQIWQLSDDEMEVGSFMGAAKDDAWTPKVKVSINILLGVQDLGGLGGQLPTQIWQLSDDVMEVGSFTGAAKDDAWTVKVSHTFSKSCIDPPYLTKS